MNIGPDSDGRIPEESVRILSCVGKWLEKNGESIYQTSGLPDFPYEQARDEERFAVWVPKECPDAVVPSLC